MIMALGMRAIRKLAKIQNLIGKVVGPNGTPEKINSAEIKKEKQPGEIFARLITYFMFIRVEKKRRNIHPFQQV
jgi:hypothetical protein